MKKLVLALALTLIPSLAFAGTIDDFFDSDVHGNGYGIQIDAPYLVKFNDTFSLGTELTKDLAQGNNEGYTFLVKGTVNWTGLDFSKKSE